MKKKNKILIPILIVLFIIIIIAVSAVIYYNVSLKSVSNKSEEIVIEIKKGWSNSEIAEQLKEKGLINNAFTFKIYTKLNKVSGMQAGTYKLNKNMDAKQIIDALKNGSSYYPETIDITFLEGKNMRWIAKTIAAKTNNSENDVYAKLEDKDYLNTLIDKYWFISDDILDKNIYYPLEGYLFPDTYNFLNASVTVEDIFKTMLDEMEKKLEPYKAEIQEKEISVHKLLTVASIVELEVSDGGDRAGVASVIYNRLKKNMSLGSDVTTYYGIKVDMSERDLYQSELDKYNPYNTRGPRMEGKLPVGPIASVGLESIIAALEPEETNYLYFVADKNGKTYFAETLSKHQAIVSDLKSKGLWYSHE